jgi:hypothetical protein
LPHSADGGMAKAPMRTPEAAAMDGSANPWATAQSAPLIEKQKPAWGLAALLAEPAP